MGTQTGWRLERRSRLGLRMARGRRKGYDRSSTAVRPCREEPRWQVERGDQQPERRVRIVRVIQARRVARASGRVHPEWADFQIAGDGARHEENHDEPGGEQEESKAAAPATLLVTQARRRCHHDRFRLDADWRGADRGRSAVWHQRDHGFHRGADWRHREGFWRHRRRGGDGVLYCGVRLSRNRRDRRTRGVRGSSTRQVLQLCPGGADWRRLDRRSRHVVLNRRRRQLGEPLLQLSPVRWILWLGSTPRWEAHLRPTLAPSDYGPYFARGRSAM